MHSCVHAGTIIEKRGYYLKESVVWYTGSFGRRQGKGEISIT